MMIDLHLHSRCSDGTLTPTELVERARLRGVTSLALTDHDTVAGNAEAKEAGGRLGVEVFAGVELSVQCGGTGIHLLGFGVDRSTPESDAVYECLEGRRVERMRRMVYRLNELGVGITTDEVRREAGPRVIGRLHVARVLVRRNFVPSLQAAFAEYLSKNGRAYVDRERLTPAEAVRLIRSQGGVTVLAHPGVVEREAPDRLPSLLDELTALGLDGIEAYYSQHSPAQSARLVALAAERGLLVTGGSDFHKPPPGGPDIGTGNGELAVPESCLPPLRDLIARRRSP